MYTSPPVFADGNLLSASQLNDLADNIIHFAGVAGGVNIPFNAVTSATGSGIDQRYRIRHLHRYFHYSISQLASSDDSLEIKYGGTTIFSDGGDRAAPYLWEGSIDLEDTGIITGLVYGDWYEIQTVLVQDTGSGVSRINYYLESDSATL